MKIFYMILTSLLTLTLVSSVSGARILAILPFAFKSHHFFYQSIFKSLARRGHEVVVYTPLKLPTPVPNYTEVHLNTSLTDDSISYELILEGLQSSHIAASKGMLEFLGKLTEEAMLHENIQKLAKSNEKFDIVFTETFFCQEPFLAFGHIFNAQTIALQPLVPFDIVNYAMGNPLALSYFPDFNFPFSDQMSFYERLANSFSTLNVLLSYYYTTIPQLQEVLDRSLKLQNSPKLGDMIKNISMVFMDWHPTINYARPLTPNFIPLGGLHLSSEKTPLPQVIQTFMDEAANGVVYFSLGTVVPDDQLPPDFYIKFIKVFNTLKQRVLWKTRSGRIEGLSENVMTVKWAPQQDVLAHPNCVLFLTHGGLLSQLEAINAAVPVVAIPFIGDQPFNVRFYEEKGVGVGLDFLTLSEESISAALNTVLHSPKYKENAIRLSRVFQDVSMGQADSAVFWTEYVLRHRGAPHLRPASALMPWYQLIMLDVLAAVITALIIVLVAMLWICKNTLSFWLDFRRRKGLLNKKVK